MPIKTINIASASSVFTLIGSVRIYVLALLLIIAGTVASPDTKAQDSKYSDLIKEVSGFNTERIMELARHEEEAGDTEKAMVLYMVVCNRYSEAMSDKDKELCSLAFFRTGFIHYENGRYTKALEFHVNGLKICESTANKRYAANFYKDIGIIYSVYHDYETGLRYLRKGQQMLKKHPDAETEYKLLTSIFFNSLSIHDMKGVEDAQRRLRHVPYKKTGLTRFMDRYRAALLEAEKQNYSPAISEFTDIARLARDSGIGPQYEYSAYQGAYQAYWTMGRMDSTFKYMSLCKSIRDSCGTRHKFTNILRDMSEFYERKGDLAESQRCKAEYFTEMDSIFNTREFDIAKNGQSVYEMNKIDSEIRDLQAKKTQREATIRLMIWIVALSVIAAAIVSGLLAWVYREKKKLDESHRNLFVVNRRLEANHLQASAQYRECLDLLNRKDSELERLKAEMASSGHSGKTPPDPGKDTGRYNNSNLSEEMKSRLLRDISSVMENSLEYCSENFTLDRLAELVGSNTKYVSQIINGTYGKNFSSFINEYRIRVACQRLADHEKYGCQTINAIGQSVGFRSNTTFSAVFRKLTGMSPSVYQKMALNAVRQAPDDRIYTDS